MVLGNHKPLADTGKAYQNTTLVGNWYEDRIKEDAQGLGTRMVYADVPPTCSGWQSTHDGSNQSRFTAPPPAPPKRPSMYTEANITERLQTYGQPPAVAYTMGETLPKEMSRVPNQTKETTNQHFYESKPDMQRTMLEGTTYFSPSDHTHFRKNELEKSTLDTSRDPTADALGSKGSRGEITRRPVEAGSAYGVSVFVDEYAKWPSKLAGESLSDTVAKKKTQHF